MALADRAPHDDIYQSNHGLEVAWSISAGALDGVLLRAGLSIRTEYSVMHLHSTPRTVRNAPVIVSLVTFWQRTGFLARHFGDRAIAFERATIGQNTFAPSIWEVAGNTLNCPTTALSRACWDRHRSCRDGKRVRHNDVRRCRRNCLRDLRHPRALNRAQHQCGFGEQERWSTRFREHTLRGR